VGKLEQIHPILLVEGDTAHAKLVQRYLEEADLLNCKPTYAESFGEARQLLTEGRDYAAILLDLNLPDSQGFETLERFLLLFPNQNIIVMTGQSDRELGVQAVKAGAQDFLLKDELDAPKLSKSLRYSIERSSILNRLEETQRLAHIGYWECSPSEHFFSGSEELYRIIGRPYPQLLSCEELMSGKPPYTLFVDLQEASRQQGKVQKDTWITREDGQRRYVSVFCKANRLSNGAYNFYGIIQDITERKQAQELKKARNLAEQEAKVREEFIASISHEMRTPMNAIVGMSNLLRKTPLNGEQRESVMAIQQSSSILLGIVNDILEVSSLQRHQPRFEHKVFRLPCLLADLVGVMKYRAREKGLALKLDISPEVPEYLVGDPLRLNQVLYNLVGNAIKFTEWGRVSISVSLMKTEGHRVELRYTITDTGIGISRDKLALIFEAFTRVPIGNRPQEGTGLGLAIAQKIVEFQGGRIQVESEAGSGSRFYFDLWFGVSTAEQLLPPKQKDSALPSDQAFTLLIAEDHKMNQVVARKTLEQQWANARILVADNGQEAIDHLKREPIHLVLMDIQMPVLDGLEATRIIRQEMEAPVNKVPILAMTAHANFKKNGAATELGFDGVILKPFEPGQLFSAIEQCLLVES